MQKNSDHRVKTDHPINHCAAYLVGVADASGPATKVLDLAAIAGSLGSQFRAVTLAELLDADHHLARDLS